MSEAYLTNWLSSSGTTETRSHFHDTALREARIATEHHQPEPKPAAPTPFLSRLRLAFAGPQTDACNCPA